MFFRNVERFQKLCWFARCRNNRACAYYKIGMCSTFRKFTLTSAVKLEIFNELLQKASFEPNEKMRCLFGTAKRFLKLLWICSGRIWQVCAYHKITAHWFLSDCRSRSRSQIDSVNDHWVRGRNAGSFPEQRLEIEPNRGQWMVWFKYYTISKTRL